MTKNYIVNNLLCFLSSAKGDYTNEVLFDLIYSFYSLDEIKNSKELLSDILSKELSVRREPEKKKKDLNDVLDLFSELKSSNAHRKEIFVADSYKKMPPFGLEFISPILTNLSDEVAKINDLLPKIIDIKSDVINTADTVRSMKVVIKNIESRMNIVAPVSGIPASRSVPPLAPSPRPLYPPASPMHKTPTMSEGVISKSRSNKIIEIQQSILSNIKDKDTNNSGLSTVVGNDHVTKKCKENDENCSAFHDQPSNDVIPQDDNKNDWITVGKNRRKNYRKNSAITGCKKDYVANLKGIEKNIDIFIGRTDTGCSIDDINDYINSCIKVKAISVEKLSIKTQDYNCFKVRINLKDRDKLFNPEMWPEGIVIKKYFTNKRSN